MKLWTVWQDYFATGEGRTLMACIAYAKNEEEAIAAFGRHFNPYYALGANALEGVHENEVTQALFTPRTLDSAKELEGRAMLQLAGSFHFNFS